MQISFTWGRKNSTNPTKQQRRTPHSRDWTDSLQVNHELTYGLYHNSYPGMKLAGALAFSPIAVPVWFMGLPIPQSEDETTQLLLDESWSALPHRWSRCTLSVTETERSGWPFFSATDGKIHWEIIPDGSVTDIIRSIETGSS